MKKIGLFICFVLIVVLTGCSSEKHQEIDDWLPEVFAYMSRNYSKEIVVKEVHWFFNDDTFEEGRFLLRFHFKGQEDEMRFAHVEAVSILKEFTEEHSADRPNELENENEFRTWIIFFTAEKGSFSRADIRKVLRNTD